MLTTHFCSVTVAALAASSAFSGPLDQAKVAADAKWILHLDFEAFRKTKLGHHVTENLIAPKWENSDAAKKMNLSINLKNISSATAYGPVFETNGEGVLMISTTADVKKDMDTLVGMAALSSNEKKDVTMVQQAPFPLYNLHNSIFVAPNIGDTVILAKSRDQIDRAREVLLGKTANLSRSTTFDDYPKAANTFFFLGMADGFSESTSIPPQAQVLRETKGGRLVIGEKEQNVFLNLVFKGKDDESSTKIQQVLQGIVALVSLSQQDKAITDLAAAARIGSEGRNVSVNLQFPVAKAIETIDEKHGEPGQSHGVKKDSADETQAASGDSK